MAETKWLSESVPLASRGPAAVPPPCVTNLKSLTDWLVSTCLIYGTKHSTAYKVAGHFAEALEKDRNG